MKNRTVVSLFVLFSLLVVNSANAFSNEFSETIENGPENTYIYTLGNKEAVTLIWDASPSDSLQTIIGCHVYKKVLPTDDWVQLTDEPVTSSTGHYTFSDFTLSDPDVPPFYKVVAITEDNTFELTEIEAFYLLKFVAQSERLLKMDMSFWINYEERDLGFMRVWWDDIFMNDMGLTDDRFIYIFDLEHGYGHWGCITFNLVYSFGSAGAITFCRDFVTYMAGTGAPFHPFGGPGAKWYYDYQDDESTGYVLIEYVSDSIWEDKSLKVLQKSRFTYHFNDGSTHETDLGRAYVYNDGLRIYMIQGEQQWVLYDLSAGEDETWTIHAPFDAGCDETAIAYPAYASDTLINGEKLRYIEMAWNPATPEHWAIKGLITERIGPIDDYMFASPTDACGDVVAEGGRLRCYVDDDFGVFQTGIAPECDYLVGLGALYQTEELSVVPNPASDETVLHIELARQSTVSVNLFTSDGRLLKSLPFNVLNAGKHSLHISIVDFPSGIYLLQVQTGHSLKTMKLVVR